MSGVSTREATQRRYEHNLKLLKLDENVIKSKSLASGEQQNVAELIAFTFLYNQDYTRSFLGCISKLHVH